MRATEIRSQLYNTSQFERAMSEVDAALQVESDDQERDELIALKAWCCYRRADYTRAWALAEQAGAIRWAKECLLHLYAYAPPYKNDELLQQLAQELGDTVNVSNALVIRARDDDSKFSHDDVLQRVLTHHGNEVEVANLYHNGARFFLAKSRGRSDLVIALGLLNVALARYGGGNQNVHHRAAAHYWKSKILEALLGREAAREAAEESVALWKQQEGLDPTNVSHQKKRANALRYLADLLGAIVVGALLNAHYLRQYLHSFFTAA